MKQCKVIYDACVLYPAPLRDILVSIATTRIFRAYWTDIIHDEWIRNVLKDRPDIKPEQLARTRELMNKAIPDSLLTGFEPLINTLILPDPNDRHVLAAAIHSKAKMIITFNSKDFPSTTLAQYQLECCNPDNFICMLLNSHESQIIEALRKQRARLLSPKISADEYLRIIEQQHLYQTAKKLRLLKDKL